MWNLVYSHMNGDSKNSFFLPLYVEEEEVSRTSLQNYFRISDDIGKKISFEGMTKNSKASESSEVPSKLTNDLQLVIATTINSKRVVTRGHSPIRFTFSDNVRWRSSLTGIALTINGNVAYPSSHDRLKNAVVEPGTIILPGLGFFGNGNGALWEYTVSAMNFPDTVINFVVQ